MKYFKIFITLIVSIIITFLWLLIITIVISEFSLVGLEELKIQMLFIENNTKIIIWIFALGYITGCTEDIYNFVNKKINKLAGNKNVSSRLFKQLD